jgi:adenosylmethionine-8-amino-7-oxononanoate aminotransferase
MWGIEFVRDKATREPFDRAQRVAERVAEAAFARGLVVYPGFGNADGHRGDQVLVGPPLVVEPAELDLLVERLSDAVRAVAQALAGESALGSGAAAT